MICGQRFVLLISQELNKLVENGGTVCHQIAESNTSTSSCQFAESVTLNEQNDINKGTVIFGRVKVILARVIAILA